jgi:hypothetical protein
MLPAGGGGGCGSSYVDHGAAVFSRVDRVLSVSFHRMFHNSRRVIVILGLLVGCGDAGGGSAGDSSGGDSSSGGEAPTSTVGETDTGGSGSGSGGGDPFAADPVCSSGKMWTKGELESPLMHPGLACQTCHAGVEPAVANRYTVLGTVYPTGHEPDDCLGIDGVAGVKTHVEITTADARVVKLPVNSSGNFVYDVEEMGGALMFPITAKVVAGDKERVMVTPQASGDCNSCHTAEGANGAPGRIVMPL